jgi:hypothetical protein
MSGRRTVVSEAQRLHIPTARKQGMMTTDERGRYVGFKDPSIVYIGRRWTLAGYDLPDSPWRNPFEIGKDGTREEVIEKYRQNLLSRPDLLERLHELEGKTLACWCKPHERCHADVLLELLEVRPRP